MSRLLPTITVNTDVGVDNTTNTLQRSTSSNVRHIAAPSTKKRRAVRKITAKLPRLPRQLNVKGVSDSGGSSADEHGKSSFSSFLKFTLTLKIMYVMYVYPRTKTRSYRYYTT